MSTSVDNRVVSMRFDNKQFESGTKQTMSTLDKLKEKLNLPGASKGLENVGAASKRVSFDGISRGIEAVQVKFSALQVVAITALSNITNSAVNAGKELVRSLTIAPLKDGFDEYELKMGAIQTIMAGTGESLESVNTALAELNKYSDETIYSFKDMTSNIGKFTNSGISLKGSVASIKGISNVAAISGANAEEASRAMYNFAQALSQGSVKLMDWKSIENANMATVEFKRQLMDSAVAAGTLTTSMDGVYHTLEGDTITATEGFNQTLEQQWLTTDALVATLGRYADETTDIGARATKAAVEVKTFSQMLDTMKESVGSGWATTWENIIGDKDESTKLFTAINNEFGNIVGASADARNAMLLFWKTNGGRDKLIEALANSFKVLMSIVKPIGEAFRDIFPAMTGERLVKITTVLRDFTAKLTISEKTTANIKNSFKGLFAVLDIGVKIFKTLAGVAGLVFKAIFPGTGVLLSLTASISDFLVYVNESIDRLGIMEKVFKAVSYVLDNIKLIISNIDFDVIAEKLEIVSEKLSPILEFVKNIIGSVYDFFMSLFPGVEVLASSVDDTETVFSKFSETVDRLRSGLIKIKDTIVSVVKAVSKFLEPVITRVRDVIAELSLQDIGAILTGVGFLKFAKAISSGISSIDDVASSINGIISGFKSVLEEVGNTLKAFQMKVKAKALKSVAIALALLAAALLVLSFIDTADLAKSLVAVTILLVELLVTLKVLGKGDKIKKVSGTLIALGISMLLLAFAIKQISSIDPNKLVNGVTAISSLMLMIALFIKSTKEGDLKKSAGGLIAFAIGITILSGALTILGNMNPDTLIQGGVAIASLMAMIALFVKLTEEGDLKKSAGGLTAFAIGITILVGALAILGNMNPDTLIQGGVAIASLMTMIALFVSLTQEGDLKKSAGGLMAFSIGITILVGALAILGNMSAANLIQGIVAIAALMTTIALFIGLTEEGDLKKSAGGLIAFSIGISILSGALAMLGSMNTGGVIQGTVAIVALITTIALFVSLTEDGDLAKSAAGLVGFSVGIVILSGAIVILSAINPDKIVQGVVAIAALMGAIALFINLTKGGDLAASAAGLIGFAAGLSILAGVIAILSALNTDKLMMASLAITSLMTVIALFTKLTSAGELIKGAIGLTIFSGAIWILVQAIIPLAAQDSNAIIAAGAAIGVIMLALAAFTKLVDPGKLILCSVALAIFAGAIWVLVQALIPLAAMNTGSIIVAGAAIGIIMLALVAFTKLVNPVQLILCSVGLTIFAAAMVILAKALSVIGAIETKDLVKGIVAIAAIFVILGLSALILTPLIPVIVLLAAAIALLGVGILGIGTGVESFSAGLKELALTGSAGAEVLVSSIMSIVELIPLVATKIAQGIIEFARTIGEGAPVIGEAVTKVVLTTLDTLVTLIPKVVDAGMKMIIGFLKGVADNIGEVVTTAIDVVLNFISAIASKLPDIIDSGFNLIISFINGLSDSIEKNVPILQTAVKRLFDTIVKTGKKVLEDSVGGFKNIGSDIISGLTKGIKDGIDGVKTAIGNIGTGALNKLKSVIDSNSPSRKFAELGKFSSMGFAVGLRDYAEVAADEAGNVGTTAMSALQSSIKNISDVVNGDIDMTPTIRPVLDLSDVTAGAGTINSMLGKSHGITIDSATRRASVINARMTPNISEIQNGSNKQGSTQEPTTPKPAVLQLMLQNGQAIAEYIVDDLDSLLGNKNQITGRMVGI